MSNFFLKEILHFVYPTFSLEVHALQFSAHSDHYEPTQVQIRYLPWVGPAYAGVGCSGKTHSLAMSVLGPLSVYTKIVLAAPTNAAVRVLKRSFRSAARCLPDQQTFVSIESTTLFKLFEYKFRYNVHGKEVLLKNISVPARVAEKQRAALLMQLRGSRQWRVTA